MSAEVLREAAKKMRDTSGRDLCWCGDENCEDNWYPRFMVSVASWLDEQADTYSSARFRAYDDDLADAALAVALSYLDGDPS